MEQDSDNEDHLYQLIQGVPAVMVSNGNSQSKNDFIPKREIIGRIFLKPTEKRFFGGKDLFFYKRSKNV